MPRAQNESIPPTKAAAILGVHRNEVARLADDGVLRAVGYSKGQPRFNLSEVEFFKKVRNRDTVSLSQAARLLRLKEDNLRALIATGILPTLGDQGRQKIRMTHVNMIREIGRVWVQADPFLQVEEAALLLGRTASEVRRLIEAGKLPAANIAVDTEADAAAYLIRRSAIETPLAQRLK